MSQVFKLPDEYKHQLDTRTEKEKILSLRITNILTEINLKRLRHPAYSHFSESINREQFHFVCLCGIPPFENQFENLDLPGSKTILITPGFDREYSPQEYIKLFKESSFQKQAQRIRGVIEKVPKKKKVILVYHSFGTFAAIVYFDIFKDNHRVSGVIDVGGVPITSYPIHKQFIRPIFNINMEQIQKNITSIYQQYVKKQSSNTESRFSNKYQLLIFIKYVKSQKAKTMFEMNRHLPPFIKLLIFGSQDTVFTKNLLVEKMIHYCQISRIPQSIENQYGRAYQKLFNTVVSNVQQRFCLNIPKGKHSIHMQDQFNADIKSAIIQYLLLIQQSSPL